MHRPYTGQQQSCMAHVAWGSCMGETNPPEILAPLLSRRPQFAASARSACIAWFQCCVPLRAQSASSRTHRFCGSVATRIAPRLAIATPPPTANESELASTAFAALNSSDAWAAGASDARAAAVRPTRCELHCTRTLLVLPLRDPELNALRCLRLCILLCCSSALP